MKICDYVWKIEVYCRDLRMCEKFCYYVNGFKKECFDGIELSKGNDLKWLFYVCECNYVFYIM